MSKVLTLQNIHKSYNEGANALHILKGLSLSVAQGEMVALVGPSGSGKSTLLHIAGLLDTPTSGEIFIQGRACQGLIDRDKTLFRRASMGFIFQHHFLLPEFTALENVMLPLRLNGMRKSMAQKKAQDLLVQVGLEGRMRHMPITLSGGERQRVAIARALIHKPPLILADEPTGSLDEENAGRVFNLFMDLIKEHQCALVCVTHNLQLLPHFHKTYTLQQGGLLLENAI